MSSCENLKLKSNLDEKLRDVGVSVFYEKYHDTPKFNSGFICECVVEWLHVYGMAWHVRGY